MRELFIYCKLSKLFLLFSIINKHTLLTLQHNAWEHQNLSHLTAGQKRLSDLTLTCALQDSLGVTTAWGKPSSWKRVLRLGHRSPEKADGFSCLAIVNNRVVTATPFLSKDSCHQKEVSQPVPDTPLQHQDHEVVSLCLHCLQEVLGLSISRKTTLFPN